MVFGTISDEEGARRKAARLCQKLDTICEDSGSCWKMSVSVGIALAPQHGRSFAKLYEKAGKQKKTVRLEAVELGWILSKCKRTCFSVGSQRATVL